MTMFAPLPLNDSGETSAVCPASLSEARPARTSPAPTQKVSASMASNPDCSSKPSELSENASLVGSLLRTALISELAAQTGSSLRWRLSATPLKRSWLVLETSARTTNASAHGSSVSTSHNLPSPVSQSQQGGIRPEGGSNARKAMKESGLYDFFRNKTMPMPMASDRSDSSGGGLGATYLFRSMLATPRTTDGQRGGRGDVLSQLRGYPSKHAGMPTPRASDMTAGGHGDTGRMGTVRHQLHQAFETLPTPTKRDKRMDAWSPAYDKRKSPTMDAVLSGAQMSLTLTAKGNLTAPSMQKWAGARALAVLLANHGLTGTAALPPVYGWMMGYPPGWLSRALRSAVQEGHLALVLPSKPSATPSSRKSPKRSAALSGASRKPSPSSALDFFD